jgi:hypothetical protein
MEPDQSIVDLLADKNPSAARNLVLAWIECRNASWANAAREAEMRAASPGHLPQIRGQLRYHLGESALVAAARAASVGAMPLKTNPPGGIFTVARVGKFALVSVTSAHARLMPRRSVTRKLLSQPNESIDPQNDMFADVIEKPKVVTDLAYFGCLVTIPNSRDPSVPAELGFGVPTASLTGWISWMPLARLHVMLQQKVDAGTASSTQRGTIPDTAFPKFRFPKKRDKDNGDDGKSV